ncbi:type II secretion system F family protein [Phenylobacterium sp. J426]|uniref:type II secretion system F family protein n=1 Tax=Phenylobacterium sp. J426 TaxID=2898439 RepID=UPI0021510BA0|nr:type II secretion system F family protein [Phenylobacterium sp. J426]MCR5876680.1 type II secretion system F family protein [Phenylobacterium sp. J426]
MLESLLLALLALSSLAMIALGGVRLVGEQKVAERLDAIQTAVEAPPSSDWKVRVGKLLVLGPQDREEISQLLFAAGRREPDAVFQFAALRLGLALLLALATALAVWRLNAASPIARLAPILMFGAAFIGAKQVLGLMAGARRRRVSAELPYTLDVLLMMLEAGVSLDQCFRTFAETEGRAAPIMQAAVAGLVADTQRGMPYDLALTRWADQLGIEGARELAAVFRQSLAQGTELSGALRAFAHEFSERRVFTAKAAIARKNVQMTVVMMLFLLPALMVILAGPAFVRFSEVAGVLSK